MNLTTQAYGKVMVSGEWGVLHPTCGCIVYPVPFSVKAFIDTHNTFVLDLSSIGFNGPLFADYVNGHFIWQRSLLNHEEQKAEFARVSCEITLRYLRSYSIPLRPFSLKTTSLPLPNNQKVGLGSSAATVVAIVKAILLFHLFPASSETIFKLAAIVHYHVQNRMGSGFDVASSSLGVPIYYHRFDAEWLLEELQSKGLKDVVKAKWKSLDMIKLSPPIHPYIMIGWTKTSASSTRLIESFYTWQKCNRDEWQTFTRTLSGIVRRAYLSLRDGDTIRFLQALKDNHRLLLHINDYVPIYTEKLITLTEIAEKHHFIGKLSGAGGGDCGIAVGFDENSIPLIEKEWEENDIELLSVISYDGFSC